MTRQQISHTTGYKIAMMSLITVLFCAPPATSQTKKVKTVRSSEVNKVVVNLDVPPVRDFKHKYEIELNYDKFEERTNVSLDLWFGKSYWADPQQANSPGSQQREHGRIYFSFSHEGAKIKAHPKFVVFQYNEYTRSYKGNTSTATFLFADRKAIYRTSRCEYESSNKICLFAIPFRNFIDLANQGYADIKVGDDVFRFEYEEFEALKDLASRANLDINR